MLLRFMYNVFCSDSIIGPYPRKVGNFGYNMSRPDFMLTKVNT